MHYPKCQVGAGRIFVIEVAITYAHNLDGAPGMAENNFR